MKGSKQWRVHLRRHGSVSSDHEMFPLVEWCKTRGEVVAKMKRLYPDWSIVSVRYEPRVKPNRQELAARRQAKERGEL